MSFDIDVDGILLQQSIIAVCTVAANHERTCIRTGCEGNTVGLDLVSDSIVDSERRLHVEFTVVEEVHGKTEENLLMASTRGFESFTGVVTDSSSLGIKDRDREVIVGVLIEFIFDEEPERFSSVTDKRIDRSNLHHRTSFAQTCRVCGFLLFLGLVILFLRHLQILQSVLVSGVVLITVHDDFAVFDEDGLIAILLDGIHGMGDQNDGLGRVLLNLGEEVVALALERLVADGEHLVEHEDVALSLDGHGERESHLHAGRVVLELLVHEVLKLGELHDVVVHRVDFFPAEAEQRAVEIYVLAAGKLWVETDSQFDERYELPRNRHFALLGLINLRDDLQ